MVQYMNKKKREGSFDSASRKRDSSVAHVTHTKYLILSRPSRESAVRIINRSFWPAASDSRRTPARVIERRSKVTGQRWQPRIIVPGSSCGVDNHADVTETRLSFRRGLSVTIPPLRFFFRIVRVIRWDSSTRRFVSGRSRGMFLILIQSSFRGYYTSGRSFLISSGLRAFRFPLHVSDLQRSELSLQTEIDSIAQGNEQSGSRERDSVWSCLGIQRKVVENIDAALCTYMDR